MLEVIRERAKSWIAKVILALLIIPFALWGVDSYFSGSGQEKPAASVDGEDITMREFQRAVRDQKASLGGKVEEKALRAAVMEQMVNSRVLVQSALKAGYSVSESQIAGLLAGIAAFQENGVFSQARLDAFLKSRGMSQAELMMLLREEHLLRQVQLGLATGAVAPDATATQLGKVLGQQREVSEQRYALASYAAGIQISEAEARKAYDADKTAYATPAQVRVQYAVLSMDDLAKQVSVSEAQARAYYDGNAAQFQEPERRRASHILIQAAEGDAKQRSAAKAVAQQVLAEVRKDPARFAELARRHSADPGSAAKGGDLGAFTRDMMVKPFADAVWAMQPGQISDLVESQFGFHVIRLDGVLPGARMGFAVVRDDIESTLRAQEAQKRFADAAERFSNMVYEQADSLEPVAKAFGLTLASSDWLSQQPAAPGLLSHPRLLEALFSTESLEKHHNVEAVEVAPNTLVSARVLESRPAGTRPFAEVAGVIREKLATARAKQRALEMGKTALASLRAGKSDSAVAWSAPMSLSRMQAQSLPRPAVDAIFSAPVKNLPTYVGVELEDGYRIYRINRVTEASIPVTKMRGDLRRVYAQEETRAYLESLKTRSSVDINPEALRVDGAN